MNFLAHLSLSGSNPKIMVGNFIGDFVKGRALLKTFESEIATGIEFHRGIDFYTDSHSIVQKSKNRLRPKYNHYAGVIVDMFYDHLLAVHWKTYYPIPLADFADNAYRVIQQHEVILPEKAKRIVPYIVKGNWLVGYASIEGIHRALSGMSRRSHHESKMEEASEDLRLGYADFEHEFKDFFPDLQRWANEWLADHLINDQKAFLL
jgi:acyl carrier protein phosphodiesterase